MKSKLLLFFVAVFQLSQITCRADSFGTGGNAFDIEFVTIGDPNNPGDLASFSVPHHAGSVPYSYRIGKYEISTSMVAKASRLGGLGLTQAINDPDKPSLEMSWIDAARFVNWLNISSGNEPAYKFDRSGNLQLWQSGDMGFNPNNLYRNSQAKYFLPNADEWYKAAYYDPDSGDYYRYPTGSDTMPTSVASGTAAGTAVFDQLIATGPADITQAGGLSPYGTMAQGGNVTEWIELEDDLVVDLDKGNFSTFIVRGGRWQDSSGTMGSWSVFNGTAIAGINGGGFRVASVIPEPSTLLLLVVGIVALSGAQRP